MNMNEVLLFREKPDRAPLSRAIFCAVAIITGITNFAGKHVECSASLIDIVKLFDWKICIIITECNFAG